MEHAPTIGALCGGRLAKAKGVRYGPPSLTISSGNSRQPYFTLSAQRISFGRFASVFNPSTCVNSTKIGRVRAPRKPHSRGGVPLASSPVRKMGLLG